MLRRVAIVVLLAALVFAVACTNKKVNNPLANVGSKQPDKVLFDRAMDAMKHNRFDVARITLQTLINTYPDSEFIARAKLAVADSWYAEGGSTSLSQAEAEYKDFETFFPNMPEAAEAQVKIANIHYQQMEKPDREFTHAMRAEEEYRQVILQYPDNKKMVAEAKQRLLEVQEIIAEREFRVGHFYYLRESYPAAIARLRSLVDKYPLYSKADEALFLLGQAYEGEIAMVRSKKFEETRKANMIQDLTKNAAEAYSRILTRYPLMGRVDDAKSRLQTLHQPVPRPTKQAIALNKREEDSRRETPMYKQLIRNFSKRPDTEQAAKIGDPTLVDPPMTSATEVVQQTTRAMMGTGGGAGKNSLAIEAVGNGAPPPSQPAPRSDTPPSESAGTQPENSTAPPADSANELKPNVPADSNELKPNTPADSNELKPNVSDSGGQALPPPQQVNEIQPGPSGQPADAQAGAKTGDTASSSSQQKDDDETISSSKKKKKKGLKKIVPF
jgi:outer membrane protein assembly factor BamD